MNSLRDSIKRSDGVVNTARCDAMAMKQAGTLGAQLAADSVGGLGDWQSQARDVRRYSQFRNWLYSAVNARAQEGAGQAVNVGRLLNAPASSEDRSRMPAVKAWHRSRMTSTARRKSATRELEVLEDHPLLLALERPNSIQYRWQFVYDFFANLDLTGWAYVIRGEWEGKMEYYCLPTTWITPIHEPTPFARFEMRNPKKTNVEPEYLDREQVAFAHLPNPSDPLSAMAPASSQIMAIRIDDSIQTSQEQLFSHGVFPSVVITIGKRPHPGATPGEYRPRLTGPQYRQISSVIRKRWEGVCNYGSPAIIDGQIEKIDRLSAVQNEMGWEKSEDRVRDRILCALRVPPYVLGKSLPGSYAQAYVTQELYYGSINSYLDLLGTLMTNFVGTAEQDDSLLIWWDKCVAVDPSIRSKEMIEARKSGDVTRDENRAYLGLPPAEAEEAKRSKLLDTVGGMTGYNQLMERVGKGSIPRDAAVKALMVFFQIEEDVAKMMVGDVGEGESLLVAADVLRMAVEALRATPEDMAGRLLESV